MQPFRANGRLRGRRQKCGDVGDELRVGRGNGCAEQLKIERNLLSMRGCRFIFRSFRGTCSSVRNSVARVGRCIGCAVADVCG